MALVLSSSQMDRCRAFARRVFQTTLVTALSYLIAPSANSAPWPSTTSYSCPGSSAMLNNPAPMALLSVSKLSIDEFPGSAISPSSDFVLERGTELNVVVDPACLRDPRRGPQKLLWLRTLSEQLEMRGTASERNTPLSRGWVLEDPWRFTELQAAMEAEPCIELASPDGKFFPAQTLSLNDPNIPEQSHLAALRFNQALPDFTIPLILRPSMTIAIIDTGVDFKHPDLAMNRWVNRGEIPNNGRDDDRNGYVDDVSGYNFALDISDPGPQGSWSNNIHGTHVAGLAAARLDNGIGGIGVDGLAKIMSLNIFTNSGFSRSSILENAIRYAADEGADIINMSLGGNEYSRTMRAALDYASRKGSLMVVAAGNSSSELCDTPNTVGYISPAAYGNVVRGMLVVTSIDAADGTFSSFSNYSSRLVEIAAPGAYRSGAGAQGLLSTAPGGSYTSLFGTSMAAPVVSGAAALVSTWLKAYRYGASPTRIESVLRESARSDARLSSVVQNGRVLDLVRVVDYLKANYPARQGSQPIIQPRLPPVNHPPVVQPPIAVAPKPTAKPKPQLPKPSPTPTTVVDREPVAEPDPVEDTEHEPTPADRGGEDFEEDSNLIEAIG